MPRYDATGPMGAGPMTGKATGPCGRGVGCGFGRGNRYSGRFTGRYYLTAGEELESLKDEAATIEADLKALREQISEIEGK